MTTIFYVASGSVWLILRVYIDFGKAWHHQICFYFSSASSIFQCSIFNAVLPISDCSYLLLSAARTLWHDTECKHLLCHCRFHFEIRKKTQEPKNADKNRERKNTEQNTENWTSSLSISGFWFLCFNLFISYLNQLPDSLVSVFDGTE